MMMTLTRWRVWFVLILAVLAELPLAGADVGLKVVEKAVPSEVGASIQELLQPHAIQLLAGDKPIYEFWLRRQLPSTDHAEGPAKGLSGLSELTVLGVAVVGSGQRDYKDNEITPGTYVLRFGLQPQDGDHLGTAEFPFFAVLTPVKLDTGLDSLKTYRAMVRASAKATAAGHPAVLSLRPPSADSGSTAPKLTVPVPEHGAVQVSIPAGPGQAPWRFEVVYHGRFKS